MAGFDILTLVGEPWNDSGSAFRGIGLAVTDTASLPSSKFLELVLNGASVYRVMKTGETIISNPTGNSLGGMRLAGDGGMMALTSQMDLATGQPAQVLSYFWENPAETGYNPKSEAVLQGMGSARFSVKSQATFAHLSGNSRYEWAGALGPRIQWTGLAAASAAGMTIDFNNLGQTPRRASPIVSFSGANLADDLVHFGITDGANWRPNARVDAAGRAQFQMLDLSQQIVPGDPAFGSVRLYALQIEGVTHLAFRDSGGAEMVLTGYANNVVANARATTPGTTGGAASAQLNPSGSASPSDLTIGGLSGQVLYNNGGVIGGVTGITITAGAVSVIAIAGDTVTSSSPPLSVTQTWNSAPDQFHAIEARITDNGSHYTSTLFRGQVNGIDRVLLTRDDTLMFGPYDDNPIGIRRNNGSVLSLCSLLSASQGKIAPVVSVYWDSQPLANGRANEEVAVLRGHGTNRLSIESAAAMVHIAETGRFEWEAGYDQSGSGRISWVGYQKASAEGRTFDFNNFGQTPARADPIVSFSSDVDTGDLVHFSRYDGSLWNPRGKVDAMGRAMFQSLDLPRQAGPGNPEAGNGRLYAKDVGGTTKLAFLDETGAESVLGAVTPGGSEGAVQYNHDGGLAGATGISITDSAVSQVTVDRGVVTTSNPAVTVTQTWNNTPNTFHPFEVNVTDNGSHHTSTLFRGTVNGVDHFQLTRDDALVFGSYDGQPAGIRRMTGSVLGMCSLLSNTDGKICPVLGYYWQYQLPNGRADQRIAVMRGFGTEELKIESLGKIALVSETGAYNMEVGWNAPTGRMFWSCTEKESTEGRTIDFNNLGQSPYAAAIASFTSEVDNVDLLHFSKWTGSDWTVRGKVDAMGRAAFQSLDLPEQGPVEDPTAGGTRLYAKNVDGVTRLAYRTAAGTETLLGASTAQAETIEPTHTITLYDAAGNAYKIPCVPA